MVNAQISPRRWGWAGLGWAPGDGVSHKLLRGRPVGGPWAGLGHHAPRCPSWLTDLFQELQLLPWYKSLPAIYIYTHTYTHTHTHTRLFNKDILSADSVPGIAPGPENEMETLRMVLPS